MRQLQLKVPPAYHGCSEQTLGDGARGGKRSRSRSGRAAKLSAISSRSRSLSLSLSPLSERRSMLFNPLFGLASARPIAIAIARQPKSSISRARRGRLFMRGRSVGRPSVTDSMNPPLCTSSRKLFPTLLAQLMGNSRERGEGMGHGTGTYMYCT